MTARTSESVSLATLEEALLLWLLEHSYPLMEITLALFERSHPREQVGNLSLHLDRHAQTFSN
jgi:hypothetical protein